jgi:hypothetical protein
MNLDGKFCPTTNHHARSFRAAHMSPTHVNTGTAQTSIAGNMDRKNSRNHSLAIVLSILLAILLAYPESRP